MIISIDTTIHIVTTTSVFQQFPEKSICNIKNRDHVVYTIIRQLDKWFFRRRQYSIDKLCQNS